MDIVPRRMRGKSAPCDDSSPSPVKREIVKRELDLEENEAPQPWSVRAMINFGQSDVCMKPMPRTWPLSRSTPPKGRV